MTKHKFTVTIESKTEAEAEQKVKAITALLSLLSAMELSKMAHVVKYDPVKTALAKTYLGL